MKALVVVALMGLALVACDDKKDEKKAEGAAPTGAVVVAPSPNSTAVAVAGAVPAEEDFEEKAAQSITPANAPQEISKLEKEIGQ